MIYLYDILEENFELILTCKRLRVWNQKYVQMGNFKYYLDVIK